MDVGISMDAYLHNCSSIDSVKKLSEIGFNSLDFNLSDFCNRDDSPLLKSNYEKWFYDLKSTADENNIYFSQVHAPFHHSIDVFPNEALYEELTRRCFEACAVMNIDYAVFHPMYFDSGVNELNYDETLNYNVERICRYALIAKEYGTNVAIENIFTKMWNSQKIPVITFGHQIEDIIKMIDSVNLDNVYACLDTGHANCSGINPSEAVKKLGARLKVLHVHDNNGKGDQHLAPFTGSIDWNEFMLALKSVDYKNSFSLEIHNYIQRIPSEVIDDAARLSLKIAKHLCNMNV